MVMTNTEYMSVREAADYIGLSEAMVRYHCKQGTLRFEKLGNVLLLEAASVRDLKVLEDLKLKHGVGTRGRRQRSIENAEE